jgi:predicted lipoprotein with Yx(FWY)xxD motif
VLLAGCSSSGPAASLARPAPSSAMTTVPTTGIGAGPGASGTLTVTAQPGGVRQVTYHGHLLYHFAKDPAPGGISGEGANNVWYLLSPTGDAIKK